MTADPKWKRRRKRNLERAMQMPKIPCECGCGTLILALKADGSKRRYANGHDSRHRTVAMAARLALPEFSQPGACSQPWVDPEWFHADSGDLISQQDAKRVCFGCPIRSECLQYAVDRGEPFGIWGGLTAEQRRARFRRTAA